MQSSLNDLSQKDDIDRTVFHKCCLDQNPRLLKLNLFKVETNTILKSEIAKNIAHFLNMQDKFYNTPLQLACIYNFEVRVDDKLEIIKELLKNGADPNVYNRYSGFTPLHWASRYGEVEIIEMLLEAGAHEYTPDSKGFRPLDYAGMFKHYEAMNILINKSLENIKHYRVNKIFRKS